MRTWIALLSTLLWLPALALAAPTAELWAYWNTHNEQSTQGVDHAAWDAFLKTYVKPSVDGINRVAYGAVTTDDRKTLQHYIDTLQGVRVTQLSRAQQRAYWINLYNATTINTVLAHYPVDSILKIGISPGLFTRGPWGAKLLKIEGQAVSLDDIEHRILRPIWRDPRTHYAVNCASLGCPNLQTEAFTADTMEHLLDVGARAYVNHHRGAHFDDCDLIVSSIYEWFKADFGGTDAGVIEHLRRYANAGLRMKLGGIEKIKDNTYDWALNDAS